MKVLVIYCHPSNKSFTARMKDEFIRGLEDGGHTCQLIDLYQINFDETFSEEEYLREAFYDQALKVPEDVQAHQRLINANDRGTGKTGRVVSTRLDLWFCLWD